MCRRIARLWWFPKMQTTWWFLTKSSACTHRYLVHCLLIFFALWKHSLSAWIISSNCCGFNSFHCVFFPHQLYPSKVQVIGNFSKDSNDSKQEKNALKTSGFPRVVIYDIIYLAGKSVTCLFLRVHLCTLYAIYCRLTILVADSNPECILPLKEIAAFHSFFSYAFPQVAKCTATAAPTTVWPCAKSSVPWEVKKSIFSSTTASTTTCCIWSSAGPLSTICCAAWRQTGWFMGGTSTQVRFPPFFHFFCAFCNFGTIEESCSSNFWV